MRMRVERQCSVEQWAREMKSGMRFLVCCMIELAIVASL